MTPAGMKESGKLSVLTKDVVTNAVCGVSTLSVDMYR